MCYSCIVCSLRPITILFLLFGRSWSRVGSGIPPSEQGGEKVRSSVRRVNGFPCPSERVIYVAPATGSNYYGMPLRSDKADGYRFLRSVLIDCPSNVNPPRFGSCASGRFRSLHNVGSGPSDSVGRKNTECWNERKRILLIGSAQLDRNQDEVNRDENDRMQAIDRLCSACRCSIGEAVNRAEQKKTRKRCAIFVIRSRNSQVSHQIQSNYPIHLIILCICASLLLLDYLADHWEKWLVITFVLVSSC